MSDVKEQVRNFVIDNFLFGNASGLKDDASFLDEGIIDSTGMLELVNFIEETFLFRIDDEELIPENLDGVNPVTCFIEKKISESK